MKRAFFCLFSIFMIFSAYSKDLSVNSVVNEDGYLEATNVKGAINERIYCKNHTMSKITISVDGIRSKTDVVKVAKSKKAIDVNKGTYLSSNFDNHLEVFQTFIIKCTEGKIVECKASAAHGDLYIDVYAIENDAGKSTSPVSPASVSNVEKENDPSSEKPTKIKIKNRKTAANSDTGKNESNSKESVADELLKWKQLLDMGAISQEEYNEQKDNLLKNRTTASE